MFPSLMRNVEHKRATNRNLFGLSGKSLRIAILLALSQLLPVPLCQAAKADHGVDDTQGHDELPSPVATYGIYLCRTVLEDDQPQQCEQYELKNLEDKNIADCVIKEYIGVRRGYHMELLLELKQKEKYFFCALKFTCYGKKSTKIKDICSDLFTCKPFDAIGALEVIMVEKTIAMKADVDEHGHTGLKYFKNIATSAHPEGPVKRKECIHSTLHNDSHKSGFMQWLVGEGWKQPHTKLTLKQLLEFMKLRDPPSAYKEYKYKDAILRYHLGANAHSHPLIHNCQTFAVKAMSYLKQWRRNRKRSPVEKVSAVVGHAVADITLTCGTFLKCLAPLLKAYCCSSDEYVDLAKYKPQVDEGDADGEASKVDGEESLDNAYCEHMYDI